MSRAIDHFKHDWPVKVYLAARSEDRYLMRDLRQVLAGHALGCTSRWLDVDTLGLIDDPDGALMDLEDIAAAQVFVLYSGRETFRNTTGGKHVEFGIALQARKPIVLIGEPENVFHGLPQVHVVSALMNHARLGETIHLAALYGTPIPEAAAKAV